MSELFNEIQAAPVRRYLIYRAPGRDFLCVVAARSAEAAMKTARSMFELTRAAFAVEEGRATAAAMARRVSILS